MKRAENSALFYSGSERYNKTSNSLYFNNRIVENSVVEISKTASVQ